MSRQQWTQSIVLASLAGLMLLLQHSIKLRSPAAADAARAEAVIQELEAQAQQWLQQDSLWLALRNTGLPAAAQHFLGRNQLPEGLSFFLFEDSNLRFWSGHQLPLEQLLPDGGSGQPKWVQPRHYPPHALLWHPLSEGWTAAAAFPLPIDYELSDQPSDYPLRNRSGEIIAYIPADAPAQLAPGWQALLLISRLLLLACLLGLAEQGARWLQRWLPAWLTVAAAGIAGLLLSLSPLQADYPAFPWVQTLIRTPLLEFSLAHLLLLAPLGVWLLSLSQRRLSYKQFSGGGRGWTALISFGAYSSITVGLLLGGSLFKLLLLETGLTFDFSNVLDLSAAELSAVGAIVVLLLTFLLYSLWVVRGVHQLGPERNRRLLALAAAALLSVPLTGLLPLGLSAAPILLLLLLYLALLDLFVDIEAASPAWFILWLALLSGFSAGLLFKYNLDKGYEQRLLFAQKTTHPVDMLAEQELELLRERLQPDYTLGQLDSLLLYLPYLEENFQYRLLDSAEQAQLQLPEQRQHVAILPPNRQYFTYGLQWPGRRQLLAFQPRLQPSRRVIKELVPDAPQQDRRYQLSLFRDSVLIAQRGYFLRDWLQPAYWPEEGSAREELNSQRANLYYRPGNGYKIVVGETLGGYIKPVSLFSYLFALLTVVAALLFGLNRLYPFLPATPGALLFGPPSLRHRIQLSVIALTLFAFLFISGVTVASLQRSSADYQTERLLEKVEVLLRDLQQEGIDAVSTPSLRSLSQVHQVDLSAFGADGKLQASSVPFLYDQGWQAARINPEALRAYQQQGFKPAILRERAGPLEFLAAYTPVRRADGALTFFRIPFSAGNRALQKNVLSFIGNLLNVYVFLLLIAGAIAITVANSITRPLMKIGDKLRSFRLGQNEPLEWDSEDEIGQLVAEYNDMIKKLEESAEKLRRSEREGAWREMAKQVAHEIKNPLTPMKLSIQYLEHARRSDPERAAQMIGSVAQTLIEQIDGLARIATEFSNFAKMPQAQNEYFSLNESVRSVYRLFTEHQAPEEQIELQLPEEPLNTFADRGHFNRVLTNLIKNAQQAIPDGQKGHIKVSLQQKVNIALIQVQDNGSGIPEEVQPKVFQPNFTTKSSGMGLGLAMCKNMVEAAGGRIYFETAVGSGTTFTIEMPLQAGPA